ncbi:MAG: hypothetical protein ACI8PG_000444 [Planctomycetota bacterium]|jgi:hypothetical protein
MGSGEEGIDRVQGGSAGGIGRPTSSFYRLLGTRCGGVFIHLDEAKGIALSVLAKGHITDAGDGFFSWVIWRRWF